MADDDEQNEDEQKDEQATDQAEESSDEGGEQGTAEEAAENDDPDFGKKEDEPVNDVQMKYLEPLAEEQGEELPDEMSEADAANKINEMQENASG